MKKNITGFSIMIGMVLVLLMTLSAYVILAYIIPFSKNTKWIENASNAYYISYSGIEQALYHIKTRSSLVAETSLAMPSTSTATGYSFETTSSGLIIPFPWEWNSEYDSNYNIISPQEPLQLEVGMKSHNISWLNWSNIWFNFNIPSFNGSNNLLLSWSDIPIIARQLSSENDTLYATGINSYITADNFKDWTNNAVVNFSWSMMTDGVTLQWTEESLKTFYTTNCNSSSSWCTLKFSIINKLELTTNNTIIPYLEYNVDFPQNFPDRYTKIKSSGKSYWFQKELQVKVSQQTVNQALDFTVFQ